MKHTPTDRRPPGRGTGSPAPRIYGDSERFKAVVTQRIALGEPLLDELEGVRKSAAAPPREKRLRPTERDVITPIGYRHLQQWIRRINRWRMNVTDTAERHLADQGGLLLPTFSKQLPLPGDGPSADDTPRVEHWTRKALGELRALRASFGVRRNVAARAPARFEEVRAFGLIDGAVIDGWVKDVASPRTPKELADAIGAAKEIAEASLRAGLDRLTVPWTDRDDLQQLMRKWRDAARPSDLDASGAQQLDQALAALGNLVAFLASFRNAYGRGHGRTRFPAGIRAHHARLAVDIADAVGRFVVLTIDDMAQLPAPQTTKTKRRTP
jgi:hypothetical protein